MTGNQVLFAMVPVNQLPVVRPVKVRLIHIYGDEDNPSTESEEYDAVFYTKRVYRNPEMKVIDLACRLGDKHLGLIPLIINSHNGGEYVDFDDAELIHILPGSGRYEPIDETLRRHKL